MGLVIWLWMPRGLSEGPSPEQEPVERPALPAAARHIRRTKVRMSVKPRDSSPAARLQLEPLQREGKVRAEASFGKARQSLPRSALRPPSCAPPSAQWSLLT